MFFKPTVEKLNCPACGAAMELRAVEARVVEPAYLADGYKDPDPPKDEDPSVTAARAARLRTARSVRQVTARPMPVWTCTKDTTHRRVLPGFEKHSETIAAFKDQAAARQVAAREAEAKAAADARATADAAAKRFAAEAESRKAQAAQRRARTVAAAATVERDTAARVAAAQKTVDAQAARLKGLAERSKGAKGKR